MSDYKSWLFLVKLMFSLSRPQTNWNSWLLQCVLVQVDMISVSCDQSLHLCDHDQMSCGHHHTTDTTGITIHHTTSDSPTPSTHLLESCQSNQFSLRETLELGPRHSSSWLWCNDERESLPHLLIIPQSYQHHHNTTSCIIKTGIQPANILRPI